MSPSSNKQGLKMLGPLCNAPINVNPVGGGGGGVRARGGDLMPETIPVSGFYYPRVRLLIVRSDPWVGTFDFHRQKPGINSEAVTKSVP